MNQPMILAPAGKRPEDFIQFAVANNALRFLDGPEPGGFFKTKAGRLSPYFFNAGLFNNGYLLGQLASHYAVAIIRSGIEFDMLFGPAYKGIPLVAAISIALAAREHNYPFAFNRKEAKDHGEGGNIVGAPLQGRVLVVDDVISAGTSVRESVQIIRDAGAEFAGLAIALNRQERGQGELSAVQEVERDYGVPVVSIASLSDIIALFERTPAECGDDQVGECLNGMLAYREKYGERIS